MKFSSNSIQRTYILPSSVRYCWKTLSLRWWLNSFWSNFEIIEIDKYVFKFFFVFFIFHFFIFYVFILFMYYSRYSLYWSFFTKCWNICSDITWSHLHYFSHVNFRIQSHFSCQNFENFNSSLLIRDTKCDFLLKSSSSPQTLIYTLRACCGSYNNNISFFIVNFIQARSKLCDYSHFHIFRCIFTLSGNTV